MVGYKFQDLSANMTKDQLVEYAWDYIIVLNSLIVEINGILNANLELSMLINIALVVRAYSYRTSKELG
jgi:hypothetical protein